ncbi:hypothetical protein L1049_000293 [Liquidambar formosana]|uniref:Uncharacterized protein n=1 Tax=Liquidambar formosana TaxID=63359 RepID=A0AAP0NC30_LIQFO
MLILGGTHQHGGKCCKSSIIHKHGCSTGSCHSSHNHQHQHCSSHNIAQTMCEPQQRSSLMCASKCQSGPFSSSSCENKKCRESADKADGCVGGDVCHKAKHCEHGSCCIISSTHDQESCNANDHGCSGPFISSSCGNDKCIMNSVEKQGGCELHKVKHSAHGQCNAVSHDLGLHSSSRQGQQMTNSGHCHVVHCAKDHISKEDTGNIVETTCDFQPEIREVCCESKKLSTNSSASLDATIDNARSCGHVESRAMDACMSLEKREFGGCCKSFRTECCAKHGHFGVAFGGSLSEIIIE